MVLVVDRWPEAHSFYVTLCHAIVGLSFLLVSAGCDKASVTVEPDVCATVSDCEAGEICDDRGICVNSCVADEQCTPAETCSQGACREIPNPTCSDHNACQPAPTCRGVGTCVGGACGYPLLPVDTSCDDGDGCTDSDLCDTLGQCLGTAAVCNDFQGGCRTASHCDGTATPRCQYDLATDRTACLYVVGTGLCEAGLCVECIDADDCQTPPTSSADCWLPSCDGGECSYAVQDTASCDDGDGCTDNDVCGALGDCSGDTVICNDFQGGCRTASHCDDDATPRCQYVLAGDRSSCLRGSATGLCDTGLCVECIDPADCQDPPTGFAMCWISSCPTSACDYAVQAGVECEGAQCANGDLISAKICGTSGTCPHAGGGDCGGLRCADATSCLTSCASVADCLGGLPCDLPAGGECQLLADDASCNDNGECINVCIEQVCAGTSATGGVCDDALDCPAEHDCVGDVCLLVDGATCSDDSGCEHTCIASQCAPLSTVGGGCDDSVDCVSGMSCDGASTCRLDLGEDCVEPTDCGSGFCANAVCCSTACDSPCQECGSDGVCDLTPNDDDACGVIDCSVRNIRCEVWDEVFTTERCDGFGVCKDTSICTSVGPAPDTDHCRVPGACTDGTLCDGTALTCPASVLGWISQVGCAGEVLHTLTLSSSRSTINDNDKEWCEWLCNDDAGYTTAGVPSGCVLQTFGAFGTDVVWCNVCDDAGIVTDANPGYGGSWGDACP